MKVEKIIQAWKDEELQSRLVSGEMSALPAHPAGQLSELSPEDLLEVGGGSTWACVTTSSWVCGIIVSVTVCDELVEAINEIELPEPDPDRPRPKFYCFAEGTAVRTPNGQQPIESVLAGDPVLAFDFDAGAVREARVSKVDVHQGSFSMLDLQAGDQRVEVTAGHRFHDGELWRPVENLAGSRCLDSRERVQQVSLRAGDRTSKVYNLRVEELGTYFVGDGEILVRDH